MSATKDYFIARYHAVSKDQYDGWFLPNGILEIGKALVLEIVKNILKGCLPPITIPDHQGTFERVLDDMERGNLLSVVEPTLEDVTEIGTSVLALSYRHLQHGTDERPRRRMTVEQKRALHRAMNEIASQRKSTKVILWIDQAMGQRNAKDERDWVRHGILPYFAFDILILMEEYDLSRCWIFLERMISQKSSLPGTVLTDAVFHEKSYKFGTLTPVQEVASAVLGGALVEKIAFEESDKEQIRRWAAQLLEQKDAHGDKYADLLGGNTWKSRVYDADGLVKVIWNHTIPEEDLKWRDMSTQNMHGRFHGLSELLGLPDKEATSDGLAKVRDVMKKMDKGYMFHVFSARSDEYPLVKAIAIGIFLRSGRPSRTLLLLLDGTENHEHTHVLSSCILDCDELADSGALSFIKACLKFREERLGTWRTLRRTEDSPSVVPAKLEVSTRHTTLTGELLQWTWFTNALQKTGTALDCYIESIQAGSVKWG